MNNNGAVTRLAVLGARGIGAVHTRLIHQSGAEVVAILGSSEETAAKTSSQLQKQWGFSPRPYSNLDTLLEQEQLDGVVIATPPATHFDFLMELAQAEIPVFCEKPLFDASVFPHQVAVQLLNSLIKQKALPMMLGISNSYLAEAIPLKPLPEIGKLEFSFHTNGPYQHEAIAWDLLPHGFSVLQGLGIEGRCENVSQRVLQDRYSTDFKMSGVEISFDFQQGPNIPRRFAVAINTSETFERVQRGQGETYQVFWQDKEGVLTRTEDPFRTALNDFLQKLSGDKTESICNDSETNMRQILDFSRQAGLLS